MQQFLTCQQFHTNIAVDSTPQILYFGVQVWVAGAGAMENEVGSFVV